MSNSPAGISFKVMLMELVSGFVGVSRRVQPGFGRSAGLIEALTASD